MATLGRSSPCLQESRVHHGLAEQGLPRRPHWCALAPRYDLDACDIQEKYPDLFQVSLDVEVEPKDRPSREAPPWESASTRGLNPKILFSSREEQQDVLSKFGETHRQHAAPQLLSRSQEFRGGQAPHPACAVPMRTAWLQGVAKCQLWALDEGLAVRQGGILRPGPRVPMSAPLTGHRCRAPGWPQGVCSGGLPRVRWRSLHRARSLLPGGGGVSSRLRVVPRPARLVCSGHNHVGCDLEAGTMVLSGPAQLGCLILFQRSSPKVVQKCLAGRGCRAAARPAPTAWPWRACSALAPVRAEASLTGSACGAVCTRAGVCSV